MSRINKRLNQLVGRKITKIRMNEDYLVFETDKGTLVFGVGEECCSHSYFYDFYGVEKLLDNGPVISVKELDLHSSEANMKGSQEFVQVYGYEIVTESKYYGEQTSVFSFRNDNNGRYGGYMEDLTRRTKINLETVPEINKDVLVTG